MSVPTERSSPIHLNTFTSTQSFQLLYDQALRDSHDLSRALEPLPIYLGDIKGLLFEAFAFESLAQMPEHEGLLSPDETAEFMLSAFYTNRTVVNRPFGRKDLPGYYMPDGVYIKDGVLHFFEYTAYRRFAEGTMDMKRSNFEKHCGDYGIPRATLTFVLPSGIDVPQYTPDDTTQFEVAPPIILPISADDLSRYTGFVYGKYRVTPNSPTLFEYRTQTAQPQY